MSSGDRCVCQALGYQSQTAGWNLRRIVALSTATAKTQSTSQKKSPSISRDKSMRLSIRIKLLRRSPGKIPLGKRGASGAPNDYSVLHRYPPPLRSLVPPTLFSRPSSPSSVWRQLPPVIRSHPSRARLPKPMAPHPSRCLPQPCAAVGYFP